MGAVISLLCCERGQITSRLLPVPGSWGCKGAGLGTHGLETVSGLGTSWSALAGCKYSPHQPCTPLPWHPFSMRPSVPLAQSLQKGAAAAPGVDPLPGPCLGGCGVKAATLRLGRAWGSQGLSSAWCHLPSGTGVMLRRLCGAVTDQGCCVSPSPLACASLAWALDSPQAHGFSPTLSAGATVVPWCCAWGWRSQHRRLVPLGWQCLAGFAAAPTKLPEPWQEVGAADGEGEA